MQYDSKWKGAKHKYTLEMDTYLTITWENHNKKRKEDWKHVINDKVPYTSWHGDKYCNQSTKYITHINSYIIPIL